MYDRAGALIIIILFVQAVIFGALGAYIASQKNRSALSWFVLGFLFSLPALLALIAVPSLVEHNSRPQYRDQHVTPNRKFINSESEDQVSSRELLTKNLERGGLYSGDMNLDVDAYKIYLTTKYTITKNEILGGYVFEDKIFESLGQVLEFLHGKERSLKEQGIKFDANSIPYINSLDHAIKYCQLAGYGLTRVKSPEQTFYELKKDKQTNFYYSTNELISACSLDLAANKRKIIVKENL